MTMAKTIWTSQLNSWKVCQKNKTFSHFLVNGQIGGIYLPSLLRLMRVTVAIVGQCLISF